MTKITRFWVFILLFVQSHFYSPPCLCEALRPSDHRLTGSTHISAPNQISVVAVMQLIPPGQLQSWPLGATPDHDSKSSSPLSLSSFCLCHSVPHASWLLTLPRRALQMHLQPQVVQYPEVQTAHCWSADVGKFVTTKLGLISPRKRRKMI